MKTYGLLLAGILLLCCLAPGQGSAGTTFEIRKTRFQKNYTDAAFDRLADFPDSMTCNP